MSYATGERNGSAKVTDHDVWLIRSTLEYRDKRIAEIDDQIEALKQERINLRRNINHKQLALKFELSTIHVERIINFRSR